jgi:WD40 repeat protein
VKALDALGSCLLEEGQALAAQGRFEDAEPLLLGGYQGLEAAPNARPAWVRQAVHRIIQLYEAWRQPRKTIAALAKLRERHHGDGVEFFSLAIANWPLDKKDEARQSYDRGNQWLARNAPGNVAGLAWRDEAAVLLGLPRLVPLRGIPYTVKESHWPIHVIGVALSPDGRLVLAGGDGNDFRLYEVETGKEIRRFQGHTHWVYAVALSPDGRQALSGGEDKTLRLWDVDTGKEVGQFAGHTVAIRFVAFSPDGRLALSGDEQTIRLWDVATRKELRQFVGHAGKIHHAVFSPDGRQVLSASADKTIRLWEVATGKQIRQFQDPGTSTCICFAPDGQKALSASPDDPALRLWDVNTGKLLRRLEGFQNKREPPHWVVFTPDGRRAVSAHHMEGRLRLWDVDTGEELDSSQLGRPLRVNQVAVSLDGRFVASANWRGSVSLWRLSPPATTPASGQGEQKDTPAEKNKSGR